MYKVKKIGTEEELVKCSVIRKSVFGDEENAPDSLYLIDEVDRLPETKNYLIRNQEKYVGTGRYTNHDATTARIQRMAVLKKYRGQGLASKLLKLMEKDLSNEGYTGIILDSASSAKLFYEHNGYKVISAEFYEDGRPHITMKKIVTN